MAILRTNIGGDMVHFVNNASAIGAYIREIQLQAFGSDPMPGMRQTAVGIRGGIRVPHLHYKDRVYPMTDKQWSEYSKTIVADAKRKLAKTNTMNFEAGVMLGSAL